VPFLGKTPTVGNFILLDAITVSNTATFALTKDTLDYYPGSAQNMIVSVNGVTQAPLTAYTITDSNIIFSSALDSDVDVIDYILVLGDTLNIGRPSDSTVGATQLQDYAVTSVKMSNTGVGAATYGTSTSIPQITIDAAGRITSAIGIDRSNQFEDLTVTGNLTVSGNTVTVDAQTLSVEDPLIHLASNNETSDVVDIGFIGHYSNDGGTTKLHTGFFRDASDEQYYLFNGFEDDNLDLSNPSTTIDRTANTFALADLNTGKITATVDSNIAAAFSSTTTTAKITLADANDQAFIDINASRIGIGHASSASLQALQIEPTSAEAMRIDSSGNVGIGTTSPDTLLHVSDTSPHIDIGPQGGNRGKIGYHDLDVYIGSTSSTGKIIFKNNIGSTDSPQTSGDTKMVITDTGVGIGTTSTSGIQGLLHIHSSSDDNGDGDGQVNFGDESTVIISTNATTAGGQGYYGSLFFGGQDINSATQQVWKLAGFSAYSAPDLGTTGSADLLFYTTSSSSTPTERMRIDSSGNVGIGTTSPGRNLEIAGTGTDVGLNITKNTVGTARFAYDATGPYILDENSNPFRIYTGGAESMRIDSSGNVGIGTVTATYDLTVVGASNLSTIGTNDAALRLRADGARAMQFYTNSAEAMRINSAGNVGIGTSSPSSTLHLYGTGSPIRLNIEATTGRVESRLDNTSGAFIFGIDDSGGAGFGSAYSRNIYSNGAYPMLFWTNNAERMRIDSSGNVGIGNTSPVVALHVITPGSNYQDGALQLGGSAAGLGFRFEYDQSAATTSTITANPTYTNAASKMILRVDGDLNTNHLVLLGNGRIGIGTDSPARILHVEQDGLADLLLRDTSSYSVGTGPAVIFQGNDSGSTITQFGAIYGISNGSNSGELTFETRNSGSSAERMRITSSGTVQGLWDDNTTHNASGKFVKMTQAQYNAITPDSNTIYFIT